MHDRSTGSPSALRLLDRTLIILSAAFGLTSATIAFLLVAPPARASIAPAPTASTPSNPAQLHDLVTAAGTTSLATDSWALAALDPTPDYHDGYAWYDYPTGQDGHGVTIYILDSGLLPYTPDLTGRTATGYDAINDTPGGTVDATCDPHGTDVADAAAGTHYGAAPAATITPVRVMPCDANADGSYDAVERGVNWILEDHAAHPGPAVVNMSFAATGDHPAIAPYDQLAQDLIDAGITVVAAAGNETADACTYAPAQHPSVLTVGALNYDKVPADFSNTGDCIDLWAPGVDVPTAAGDDSTTLSSGTSLSSPLVAGLAARHLSTHPTDTPNQVTEALLTAAGPTRHATLPTRP